MEKQEYIREVMKRVNLPEKRRAKAETRLRDEIERQLKKGKTMEQISQRLGSPLECAKKIQTFGEAETPFNAKTAAVYRFPLWFLVIAGGLSVIFNGTLLFWEEGQQAVMGSAAGRSSILLSSSTAANLFWTVLSLVLMTGGIAGLRYLKNRTKSSQ
ncbi:HAAS signaling domain-containing protein [Acidaminobacterium chupaoyuni]